MVPGLKFSATTSALPHRRRAISAPSGLRRSSAMLFLLRLNIGKKPAPAPSRWRVRSPSIGSTLITSAPRSASTRPQVGPMTMWVNSTTRRPASGSGAGAVVALLLMPPTCRARRCVRGRPARHSVPCSGLAFQPLRHLRAQGEQPVEVDAGFDAHAGQQVGQVLGGDVAAGARRMRAAADAAEAGIEPADAQPQRGVAVGQAQAAGVVEMGAVQAVAGHAQHLLEQRACTMAGSA